METRAVPLQPPSLRHIVMIAELSRSSTISECSKKLFLSKAAVTTALKDAEQRLGQTLFKRSNRGVAPAPEGELFAKRCIRAENLLKRFQRFAPATQAQRGIHQCLTDSQLRALIEVTQHQNYSLAAHHTGLAQPTLHRSIRELEALLGQPLFRRAGRGVEATRQARSLARLANLAYAEIQQGIDELEFSSGMRSGQLRIGCLPMARTDLLPESIALTMAQYPAAKISIVDGPYEEQLGLLLQGSLDLVIGALRHPAPTSEISQQPLFDDQLGVVVRSGHPLLAKENLQVTDLANLEWIVPRAGTPTRNIFNHMLGTTLQNTTGQPIECSSMVAIRGLLVRTDRAVLISVRQMRPELDTGQVAVLPLNLPLGQRTIGYSTRIDWQPTPLQASYIRQLAICGSSTSRSMA